MKLTFIVPAFNEAATIGEVLTRVHALGLDTQVIVVDDGSTDQTAEIAEGFDGVQVVRQQNRARAPRSGPRSRSSKVRSSSSRTPTWSTTRSRFRR